MNTPQPRCVIKPPKTDIYSEAPQRPRERVWDDDYEPTPEELHEDVSIDATPEELAKAVLGFKPPRTVA